MSQKNILAVIDAKRYVRRKHSFLKENRMTDLLLLPLSADQHDTFSTLLQRAFQKGAEDAFGKLDEPIISREDIDKSLLNPNADAFFVMKDDAIVGGAVIAKDRQEEGRFSLDLLFTLTGKENSGIGIRVWEKIEAHYPEAKIWETHTPYFEKRNIHFYVNKCGFHIVEFFHPGHPDPHGVPEDLPSAEYFFRFEKVVG